MKIHLPSDKCRVTSGGEKLPAHALLARHSSLVTRHREQAIALVITLIMLAITLVMAVAFLALARRERGSVTTTNDTATARLAAETALASAQAQIVANVFNNPGNAYNLRLLVSTNYINPFGFTPGSGNPTNVNYDYYNAAAGPLSVLDFEQNVSNLYFLPRPPVFVPTNPPLPGYDFRYYLDLNENGRFDTNGLQPVFSGNPASPFYDTAGNLTNDPSVGPAYIPPTIATILDVGDPEWVGVLEHPDAPHGPNNPFISRYAFIALPVGNSLDINYIHNQARNNGAVTLTTPDDFMRNQGVGSWEINLAAFLADLNTNTWGQLTDPAGRYYEYNEPSGANNTGFAFEDARALVAYRYNYRSLPFANSVFFNPANAFLNDGIDDYSRGPLQTTLDTNEDFLPPTYNAFTPWSGADNTNHYFTLGDFFDASKVQPGIVFGFTNRLRNAGNAVDTYGRYTFYRMLDQLGSDSTADEGKLNLNYANAVVSYDNYGVPTSVAIVPGAETNQVRWWPLNFFTAAADRMLRTYTTNWFQANPSNFIASYYGLVTNYGNPTGFGLTNYPVYGLTNEVPAFGITNIPVLINGSFVYSPAINRLLQLAANLYDATTNGNNNLPHVFRPMFERDLYGNVFIVGYTPVTSVTGPNDPQLDPPESVSFASTSPMGQPVTDRKGSLVNLYGVPWIIGAKQGLPNFNQFYLVNAAQVTRKLEVTRSSLDPATATYTTNQMYVMGISNYLGVSFWNSYTNNYVSRSGQGLTIFASDTIFLSLTNGANIWSGTTNFTYTSPLFNTWVRSQWSGTPPNAAIPSWVNPFITLNWSFNFLNQSVYRFGTASFDPVGSATSSGFETTTPALPQLPQFGLQTTNYLQAYILDGHNVIDYVQLRDPISNGNLNQALADPDFPDPNQPNVYHQWSTNSYQLPSPDPAYGVINQINVSKGVSPAPGNSWVRPPGMPGSLYSTTPGAAEIAFFNGLWNPNFRFEGKNYSVTQLTIQAPYTPSRTVYSSYLLQANDPLVHYLGSDMNSQMGTWAFWDNKLQRQNGLWYKSDDSSSQPLPAPPRTPIGGRYQPWLQKGQMEGLPNIVEVTNNYAVKDPLVEFSDNWDFPTNLYPTVGWIGRVHRGTPWQTVYLKDADMTKAYTMIGAVTNYVGLNTWAQWTGDIQTYFGQYFDAANDDPVQDRLLFDIFTARLNDNATRGTLPVNQTHLAAWSALFSGMVAISNSAVPVFATTPLTYTNLIINPAGVFSNTLPYTFWPALAQIVNGPLGINATRANTNLFPLQAFTHLGDILSVPALSGQSPLLHPGPTPAGFGQQQRNFGISDEEYEWLPQQMMGLVRLGDPRFVLYCFGQALSPAPGGEVLSGPFFQLITNYQVTAESAVRAVVSVHPQVTATSTGYVTNYTTTVDSYNVLPP